jgi:hypothetical protein
LDPTHKVLEGEGNGDGILTPDDFPDTVELKRTITVVDREIASVKLEVVPIATVAEDPGEWAQSATIDPDLYNY